MKLWKVVDYLPTMVRGVKIIKLSLTGGTGAQNVGFFIYVLYTNRLLIKYPIFRVRRSMKLWEVVEYPPALVTCENKI